MKPVIGTIVVFHVADNKLVLNNFQKDAPAIVTAVWSESNVNLKVLYDGIHTEWNTSVPMGDKPWQWSWPVVEE